MTTPRYTELADQIALWLDGGVWLDKPFTRQVMDNTVAALRHAADLEREVAELRGRLAEGAGLIASERQRQVDAEGWTPDHDDEHTNGELYRAAEAYLKVVHYPEMYGPRDIPDNWPWDSEWWKPSDDPIRNLVKAGALIAAEIDRRARLAAVDQTGAET